MATKESKDGNEQADYDEEFFYGFDDPEFQKVYSLCKQWCAASNISGGGYNSDMGEAVARKFEKFVRTEHSEVARMVEKDSNIYEAVFVEWSCTAESEEDSEEEDDDNNNDDGDEEKETINRETIAQNVPTPEPSKENEKEAHQTEVFDAESLDSGSRNNSDGIEDAEEDGIDLVAADDSEHVGHVQ